VWAGLALFAHSPWALLGVAVVLVAGVGLLVRRRLLRRSRRPANRAAQAEV
jgi:membrane protein implicated in regulation of membrane protease activity